MRLSREDYMALVNRLYDGRTDDEALADIEDLTDTYDELENNVDRSEIEALRSENENLRQRYRDRFFNPVTNEQVIEEQKTDVIRDGEDVSFDDLFEAKEGDK